MAPAGGRHDDSGAGTLKAILPVHAFGQPADLEPIVAVARAHDVALIEDACEAIGATYEERQAGAIGDVGVFAFYPNKQMTTGEGGMIVTNRDDWARYSGRCATRAVTRWTRGSSTIASATTTG